MSWVVETEAELLAATDMLDGTDAFAQDTENAYKAVGGAWIQQNRPGDERLVPDVDSTLGRPLVKSSSPGVEYDPFPLLLSAGAKTFGQSSTTEQDLLNGEFTIPAGSLPFLSVLRGAIRGTFFNDSGASRAPILRCSLIVLPGGGVGTMFDDTLAAIPASATDRPFAIDFELSEYSTPGVQWFSGTLILGHPGTAGAGTTAGTGDLSAESSVYHFSGTTGVDMATTDIRLEVTIQMPTSSASLYFQVVSAMLERR